MAKRKIVKAEEKVLGLTDEALYKFHHANLYYVVMAVSMVLFCFFIVQGVIYQVYEEVTLCMLFYTMAVMLAIVAFSSYHRGKGHYHYHRHII